jgi:Kef-type K+ transport system membrane component KefB
VLRERGLLGGRLGGYLLAAGGVGELLPVLAIAVFLGTQGRLTAVVSLLVVVVLAAVLGLLSRAVPAGSRLAAVITAGQNETAQITLRGTILLLLALVAITDEFHLDAVLGAFVAGMVLRRWVGGAAPLLESKLDAVGYGFFVPLFFVYSGMGLDLHAIMEAPLRLVLFFVLMLVVRGGPVLVVYRGVLSWRERGQTALVSATALPVLVALTEIGLRSGTMLPENAAALVGAGMVTVLTLPALAIALDRRPSGPAPSEVAAEPGELR